MVCLRSQFVSFSHLPHRPLYESGPRPPQFRDRQGLQEGMPFLRSRMHLPTLPRKKSGTHPGSDQPGPETDGLRRNLTSLSQCWRLLFHWTPSLLFNGPIRIEKGGCFFPFLKDRACGEGSRRGGETGQENRINDCPGSWDGTDAKGDE